MDFKQLEAYVKTVELNSFSRAAEAIYLSQPSVSLYVNSLEKELKTQLIVRSPKEIMPTKNGRIFYEYAKNILALKEKAVFAIHQRTDSLQGEIQILASSVPAQYILPEVIVDFNKEYPQLSFLVAQSDTEGVVKGIVAQKYEFGIVGAKMENSQCYYEHIFSEPLILIGPPDKQIAIQSLEDIRQIFYIERFIAREPGSGTRYCYEEFIRGLGVKLQKLNIAASFSNTQGIIHAVSKGLGISIVSSTAAKGYLNQGLISQIELDMPMPVRDFYFVYKKDVILSPQAKLFVNFTYHFFKPESSYR